MKRPFIAMLLSAFALGPAIAQESCAAKAVGKNGKPLSGGAKTSSIKKCCQAAAVGSDGKKLASGAAKTSFIKKCEAGT
jgi:hypothetical protein